MATEKLEHLRRRLRQDAADRGVSPRDVDLLLTDVLRQPLSFVISRGETPVDPAAVVGLVERRLAGEPLQYIRGRTEFYGREFAIDNRVLIPRPETELLVEAAIRVVPRGARVVDVGTGSGCIAVTLERERPDLRVTGIDSSLEALAVAARNRERLQSNVRLAASDNLSALRRFDVVIANPPYIPESEYAELADEVRLHEPRQALTPGPRGTEAIDVILGQAAGARVLLEIGFGQERAVREIAAQRGFRVDDILPDLAEIPRVVVLSAR